MHMNKEKKVFWGNWVHTFGEKAFIALQEQQSRGEFPHIPVDVETIRYIVRQGGNPTLKMGEPPLSFTPVINSFTVSPHLPQDYLAWMCRQSCQIPVETLQFLVQQGCDTEYTYMGKGDLFLMMADYSHVPIVPENVRFFLETMSHASQKKDLYFTHCILREFHDIDIESVQTFLDYFPEHIKNMSSEDQIAAIHECFYEESSSIGFDECLKCSSEIFEIFKKYGMDFSYLKKVQEEQEQRYDLPPANPPFSRIWDSVMNSVGIEKKQAPPEPCI